jgi:hypothetical protein
VIVGVGTGVLVALGCGVEAGKGVSVATGCTADSGVFVAAGSRVGYGVSVAVGWRVGDGVFVAVGCAAISRAWAVAVARTLSIRDMVGVAKGPNANNPYPPNRQEAVNRQSSMQAPKTTKTVRSIRNCIDMISFSYQSDTISHIPDEGNQRGNTWNLRDS